VEIMNRVYVCGPMRGIKHFNFPAFDDMARRLMDDGNLVVSPAGLDRDAGFDPTTLPDDFDWNQLPPNFDFQACVDRDIKAVKWCDEIVALPGWEKSTGARAEVALGEWLGKVVTYPPVIEPAPAVVQPAPSETRGQKGDKLCRLDLLPVEELWEVAEHYGKGARKYSDDNWRKGYPWHLSFAALLRHAYAFWNREDIDAETGSHHLCAVVFHALSLMWFSKHRKQYDDRAVRPEEK
jgi:hypothetical protein